MNSRLCIIMKLLFRDDADAEVFMDWENKEETAIQRADNNGSHKGFFNFSSYLAFWFL